MADKQYRRFGREYWPAEELERFLAARRHAKARADAADAEDLSLALEEQEDYLRALEGGTPSDEG